MPGLDGTGPWGAGPMTGGARGFCNPAWSGGARPWFRGWFGRGFGGRGRGFGRGFGAGFARGRGLGRGFGWRAFAPAWGPWYGPAYGPGYAVDPSEEVDMLKAEAEAMKEALDDINKRIEELEKEETSA